MFSPKLEFFIKKELRKIPMIFNEEKYIEHQILELFDTFPKHQFSKFNN